MFAERRNSIRFEVAIPYVHNGMDFLRSTAFMTHDISSLGAGIITSGEMPSGSPIQVRFVMPDNGEVIERDATVVWSSGAGDNLFRCGVRIDNKDPLHPVPMVLRTLAMKMGLGRRF